MYCKECKNSGDLLNLAAHVWETNEIIAAKNLVVKRIIAKHVNFDSALNVYMAKWLGARKKHNAFWESAKTNSMLFESSVIRETLRALSINIPPNMKTWQSEMGQLVGFATKLEAENAILVPKVFDDAEQKKALGTGLYRTFLGKWNELVVIPFYDMPGRIREFTFATYGTEGLKLTHKYLAHRKLSTRTSSMAFFDQVFSDGKHSEIVVVDDLQAALKFHSKNFKHTKNVLPLVTVQTLDSITQLRDLSNCSFTVWNPKISSDTFSALKSSNVSFFVSSEISLSQDHTLSKAPPMSWTTKINKEKKKCLDILEEWVPTVSKIEAETTVGLTDFQPSELAEIASGKYSNIDKILRKVTEESVKTATVHGQEFFETEHGWFLKEDNSPVSLTKIKIEMMAVNGKNTKFFGNLTHDGKKIAFSDCEGKFQANTVKFVEGILYVNGFVASGINPKYKNYLKELAMAFHKPRIVSDYGKSGWDKVGELFRFSNFTISKTGEVYKYDYKFKSPNTLQSRTLEYEELGDDELANLLVDNVTNRSLWALAACVTAAILSPAITGKAVRTVLYGKTSSAADVVLSWLGVMPCNKSLFSKCNTEWPLLMPSRKRKKFVDDFGTWIVAKPKPACFIEVDDIEASMIRLMKRWPTLNIEFGNDLSWQGDSARKIVPLFVAWLLGEYGLNFMKQPDICFEVLDRMAEWVNQKNFDSEAVTASKSCFTYSSSNNDEETIVAFKRCCRYGLAKYLWQENIGCIAKDGIIYIKKYSFFSALKYKGFELVDGLDLQPALNTILKSTPEDTLLKTYFAVPSDWWNEIAEEYRSTRAIRIAENG